LEWWRVSIGWSKAIKKPQRFSVVFSEKYNS